jgi:uncharacterized protein (DUF1330 family)
MSVYVIASLTIKDAVRFEDYRRMLLPTMAKYGARLVVARGSPIVLRGRVAARTANHRRVSQHGAGARVVASPEYAEPKALRHHG